METVSNTVSSIANVASKAIWGDSTIETTHDTTASAEPLSGETGEVKAGEPYDKGNLDSTETEATVPGQEQETTLAPSKEDNTEATDQEETKSDQTSARDSSTVGASDKQTSRDQSSRAEAKVLDGPPPLTARPAEEYEKGQQGSGNKVEKPKSGDTKEEGVVGGVSDVGGGENVHEKSSVDAMGDKYKKSIEEGDNGVPEQRAVPQEATTHHATSTPSSSQSETKAEHTKVSLKDKLKAKLHKHKHDKE